MKKILMAAALAVGILGLGGMAEARDRATATITNKTDTAITLTYQIGIDYQQVIVTPGKAHVINGLQYSSGYKSHGVNITIEPDRSAQYRDSSGYNHYAGDLLDGRLLAGDWVITAGKTWNNQKCLMIQEGSGLKLITAQEKKSQSRW